MHELSNERAPAEVEPRCGTDRAFDPAFWRDYGDPELHVIGSAAVKRLPGWDCLAGSERFRLKPR